METDDALQRVPIINCSLCGEGMMVHNEDGWTVCISCDMNDMYWEEEDG